MAKKKMSQTDQILDWIMTKGSITSMEAIMHCGCTRLSARIADLREAGFKIHSQMVTENGKRFARYSLVSH